MNRNTQTDQQHNQNVACQTDATDKVKDKVKSEVIIDEITEEMNKETMVKYYVEKEGENL